MILAALVAGGCASGAAGSDTTEPDAEADTGQPDVGSDALGDVGGDTDPPDTATDASDVPDATDVADAADATDADRPDAPDGDAPCLGDDDCDALGTSCQRGVCDGGTCVVEDLDDLTPCDDQDACTRLDSCSGGQCVGQAIQCDDDNVCNGAESCDSALGCVIGDPLICDDADACNGVEVCDPTDGCLAGTPPSCDDGDACNGVETCEPSVGCVAGTPPECDDGDVCNGLETCDTLTGCRVGTPLNCDDADVCNGVETCHPINGCVPGAPLFCDDDDACNGVEACDPVDGCQSGTPPVCDDGNVCNGTETCNSALGCVAGPRLECDDNDFCNGTETCDPVMGCQPATPPVCEPFACSTPAGMCLASCLDDSDCALGFDCRVGACAVARRLVVGSFVDIAAGGAATRLDVSDEDDDISGPIALGFPFPFFGQTFTELFVSSNGFVTFDATAPAAAINDPIPANLGPAGVIAAFWDDLDPGDGGDVWFEVRGSPGRRMAIVQWDRVDFFTGSNTQLSFEVVLHEDGAIQLLYGPSTQGDTVAGRSFGSLATAGIESPDETAGVEITFDTDDAIQPGQVWLLTPNGAGGYDLDGWVAVSGRYEDLSTVGTDVGVTGDDDSATAPIGFDFSFYGQTHTDVTVSTNGLLAFASAGATSFSNTSLPNAADPNAIIAVLWDDLIMRADSTVVSAVLGTAPWRRFVVEWSAIGRIGAANLRQSFQVALHETSNAISLAYGPADYAGSVTYLQGASATIGIENHAGDDAVEVSVNQPVVEQGDVVWFLPVTSNDTSSYTVAGPTPGFSDIREVGTRLPGAEGDDGFELVDIGFDFPFDGTTIVRMAVSSNGFVQLVGTTGAASFIPTDLPDVTSPNGILAPYWLDLDPALDGGEVLTLLQGVPGSRRRIVQWQSSPHNLEATADITFQLILHEDGSATYRYGALIGSAGLLRPTVGWETGDGGLGQAIGHNVPATVESGSLLYYR